MVPQHSGTEPNHHTIGCPGRGPQVLLVLGIGGAAGVLGGGWVGQWCYNRRKWSMPLFIGGCCSACGLGWPACILGRWHGGLDCSHQKLAVDAKTRLV